MQVMPPLSHHSSSPFAPALNQSPMTIDFVTSSTHHDNSHSAAPMRMIPHFSSSLNLNSSNGRISTVNRRRSRTHSNDQPYRYTPIHPPNPRYHLTSSPSQWLPSSITDSSNATTNVNLNVNGVTGSPLLHETTLEDRKPVLGVNGSPHVNMGATLPPTSPSPSSHSRDSPIESHDLESFPPSRISHSSPNTSNGHSPANLPFALPSAGTSLEDVFANHHHHHHHQETHFAPRPFYSHATPYASTFSYGNPDISDYQGNPSDPTSLDQNQNTLAPPRSREQELQGEIVRLHNRIREVEFQHELATAKLNELQIGQDLEQQLSNDVGAQFRDSWKNRTETRIARLCSLNRAGNALCAWHDSRRERRMYQPRTAPSGVLNCGCTYEEALFEESLSRHGVGAYRPGESVRMDPALRNPLLRLLQQRYGYRDGDFERVRTETENGEETWMWPDNDGPQAWASGTAREGNSGRRMML